MARWPDLTTVGRAALCCSLKHFWTVCIISAITGFSSSALSSYAAADDVYAKPISNRMNTTGRPINLEFPIKVGDRELGDIAARIDPDDTVFINRAGLLEILRGEIDEATMRHFSQTVGSRPFIELNDIDAAGLNIRFDRSLQEFLVNPNIAQLAPQDVDLSDRRPMSSSKLAVPAYASGYVNLYADLDHQWSSSPSAGSDTSGRLQIDSALRVGGVILENTGVLAGSVDINVCPTTAICDYEHTQGFKRQISRLVYDMPEERIRTEFGDVDPLGVSFQQTPNLLGLSFEKSARKLTPNDTFAPTGSGSFVIDRPSRVEVRINGIVRQRLDLRPGTYNLHDLPLVMGSNNVEVAIIDDSGQTRTVAFASFYDANLLAEGKSEWGITAGAPSYIRDEAREYLPGLSMGSAFIRYGVSDHLTTEANVQANARIAMLGSGVMMDAGIGLLNTRTAISQGERATGFAIGVDWNLTNYNGFFSDRGESFRLASEYRSPNFHSPGDIDTSDGGIVFPEWNYWLNFDASWSTQIGLSTSFALSGRYQFVNDAHLGHSVYAWRNDRFGADLTLSRPLTTTMSGSLTIGVSNESFLASIETVRDPSPEFRIGFRLFGRPDELTNISTGYDSLDQQSDLSAYRSSGQGVGRWDTSIYAQQNQFDGRASVSATAGYYGNRAQVRVIHNSGFDGIAYPGFDLRPGPQSTSLQIGAAVAFADGHFAVGAPVTGDAFAIVYPHPSIADKPVTVGNNDNVRAIADGWGPALVSNIPVYVPSTISVDADDLPIGYSLGAAAFDILAPLKAGYDLEVGSDYSVSAYGTLLARDGSPVGLVSGIAKSQDHLEKSVPIFTNAAGRFGADGLAAGHWQIEMEADDAPLTFTLVIPPNTNGLFKAGSLRPEAVR